MNRRILGLTALILPIVTLILLSCSSPPPQPGVVSLKEEFSARRARDHFRVFDGFYPRLSGSLKDKKARSYLAREFRRAGVKIETHADGDRRHLIGERKGVSSDVVLLVAAYPALPSGIWVDDSGAAILLEIARVVESTRLPYTLVYALAETRPLRTSAPDDLGDSDPSWQPDLGSAAARRQIVDAGHSLARGIETKWGSSRIRAVVVFDTSAIARGPVARDLRSQPEFRKIFWTTAAELGFAPMFPLDGDWTSPASLHLGFSERSMDRVLALVHVERDVVDPDPMRNPAEAPLPGIFDSVGTVSVEALLRLMRRFEKVDAFSR